jgi:hypothetical protein
MGKEVGKKALLILAALVLAGVTGFAAEKGEVVTSRDGRMMFIPRRSQAFTRSAPSGAGLVTIFNNIGWAYPNGAYSCCDGFTVEGPAADPMFWQAAAFKPKVNHTVTMIEVAVSLNGGADEVVLSLNNDANGVPGTAIKTWHLTGLPAAGTCCTIEARTSTAGIPVTGGTRYWIVLKPTSGSDTQAMWNVNDTNQVNSMKTAFYCASQSGVCQNNRQWKVERRFPGPAFAVLGSD